MVASALEMILAVVAVSIGIVQLVRYRAQREQRKRHRARDQEARRNTWLNTMFRRPSRGVKRLTYRREE